MVYISRCSPSKFSVLSECLLKFKLKYIDYFEEVFNDKTKDADHLQWGSYVHRIFERGENAETIEELRIIAKEERPNYHFHDSRLKSLEKQLSLFFHFNNKIKNNSVGSEINFEIHEDDINIVTNGKIDRVVKGTDGRYLVIDYKTGKSKTRAELMRDIQLTTYVFAVCKLYNTTPDKVKVAHYYTQTGNLVDLTIPNMIYENVRKKYKSGIWKLRKLKKAELKPCLNEFCNWCGYQGICPLHTDRNLCEQRIEAYKEKKKILEDLKKAKEESLDEVHHKHPSPPETAE